MNDNEKLIQEDINEIHQILKSWFDKKNRTKAQIMGFLATTLIGTMAMHGYDEDFFDSTMDLMKKRFRKHPMRKK